MSSQIQETIDSENSRSWELMLSDPRTALDIAQKNLDAASAAGYTKGIAEAELNVGWCRNYLTEAGPAVSAFQNALEKFRSIEDRQGIMKALNALGVSYFDLGRYDRAMDYYTQSLDEARRLQDRLRESVTVSNIGLVCLNLNELKEALDYFIRAYESVPDEGQDELLSNILLNIGTTFLKMENAGLARDFTVRAMDIAQKASNRLIIGQCYLVLGRAAQEQGNYEDAEDKYHKALETDESLGVKKQKVEALLQLGTVHAYRRHYDLARRCYEDALKGASEVDAKIFVNQAYERLSEAYEGLGDYHKALDCYRRFSRYEREVAREDTNRKIKNITIQYEIEKSRQETEIYRLRNIELKEKAEELREANRQILSISELGRRITSSLDFDTIVSTLYQNLKDHLDVTVFGLGICEEQESLLEWEMFMEHGRRIHRKPVVLDPQRSYAAWCIKNRKIVFVRDSELENRIYLEGGRSSIGEPASSLIFMPLLIEQKPIGVLTVQSYKKAAYSEANRLFIEALAPYISIAVENSLIHDRLEELNQSILNEKALLEQTAERSIHLANHDALTGLPNRRLLFELLQKSFDLAARNSSLVAVLYLDLNNFKPINDHFGHAAGDKVLAIVAERLKSAIRVSDTAARVGGDEFIAVLTNIHSRADIELAAKKILDESTQPISCEAHERGGKTEDCILSISVGIAVFPQDGAKIEEIINRADEAMYRIKNRRENGFCFYADKTAPGQSRQAKGEPAAPAAGRAAPAPSTGTEKRRHR